MLSESNLPSMKPRSSRLSRLLLGTALLGLGAVYGYFLHRDHWWPYRPVETLALRWFGPQVQRAHPVGLFAKQLPASAAAEDADDADAIRRLESIGYAGGVERGAAGNGVAVRDAARTCAGWNLYHCGHAPEAVLMDIGGNVLQRWRMPFSEAFPDDRTPAHYTKDFWRRVHLYPNGDLLAIFEGRGLIKLDRDSRLVWAQANKAHHQAVISDTGEIHVLTRAARLIPELGRTGPMLEDFVSILASDGSERRRISLLKSVQQSDFLGLLEFLHDVDPTFHTNAIQLLGSRSPVPGASTGSNNALVSFRELNTVALIDLDKERATWAMTGVAIRQHDPTLLDNGNLLIFDNRVSELGSRAIEVDPRTQQVVWEYPAADEPRMFSGCCGTAQRLSNGNTLITFSQTAEALEVASNGDVVWEFHSPHRTGANDEFLAQLMELRRIGPEYLDDWADEAVARKKQ